MKLPLPEETLLKLVKYIIDKKPKTRSDFENEKRKICGKLKVAQPANRFLLQAYQNLAKKESLPANPILESFFRKADVRSISGIAVVTSLIKPYDCPGKCVYCPTEVRMPKSYLSTEPAAARALSLDFSPYKQMKQRILMLENNGHNTDKIEFIIKGGTWNAYPLSYQYWFILESFRACNDFSRNETSSDLDENSDLEELQKALEKEQVYNESANHRIIGLTLETRPDAISPKTIFHMRNQGCTRIELGLQAPDDEILELVKRGHTVDQFRHAIWLLREAGFKVDLHFMPDLPGTTPEHDVEMYQQIFEDPSLKPDMVKIYPNTVIESAELSEWLKDGRYKPYGDENLFKALLEMKKITPVYCRISRLIRDIPSDEIQAGNKITNLRENLSKELKKQGKKCLCIRCREIGRQKENLPENVEPKIFIEKYQTIGGTEYFVSFEDPEKIAIFGFIRLRLPDNKQEVDENIVNQETAKKELEQLHELLPGTKNHAFVRELHVYNTLVKIGQHDQSSSQHKGLGKALLAKAEEIAIDTGFENISVISGVGVKGYYAKQGYQKLGTYMVKNLFRKS